MTSYDFIEEGPRSKVPKLTDCPSSETFVPDETGIGGLVPTTNLLPEERAISRSTSEGTGFSVISSPFMHSSNSESHFTTDGIPYIDHRAANPSGNGERSANTAHLGLGETQSSMMNENLGSDGSHLNPISEEANNQVGTGISETEKLSKDSYWCSHNRVRSMCRECKGNQVCGHDRYRRNCRECGGSQVCPHGKQKSICKACGGSQICIHKKQKQDCRVCGKCIHGCLKRDCSKCKKCAHNKQPGTCKLCVFCEHGMKLYVCAECKRR